VIAGQVPFAPVSAHPGHLSHPPRRRIRAREDGASRQGTLYLWFPDPALFEKATGALAAAGRARHVSRACVRLPLAPGELDPCVIALGERLSEAEARRARALFIAGEEAPTLDEFGRIVSLHELHMASQTGWLLDQFEDGRITSHFQRIVHVGDTSRVFAHEALLRGKGRNGELLEPLSILQRAREAGLLRELDLAACRCAIREAANLPPSVTVFVNFSPAMLEDAESCLEATVAAIECAGLAPERFVFEVIEADRIADAERLKDVLDCYRRDGFRVALDDLGAGWSTLNLVHRLRPDFIKLDRELIREVHVDRVKDLIASKLLEIGHGLGIQTIVEGVESPQELQWARDRGADFAQGFLIARPGPSSSSAAAVAG
jgi:EAL domain-containing protein (putative c-di-GMP-specific phosphodiesterase class I)